MNHEEEEKEEDAQSSSSPGQISDTSDSADFVTAHNEGLVEDRPSSKMDEPSMDPIQNQQDDDNEAVFPILQVVTNNQPVEEEIVFEHPSQAEAPVWRKGPTESDVSTVMTSLPAGDSEIQPPSTPHDHQNSEGGETNDAILPLRSATGQEQEQHEDEHGGENCPQDEQNDSKEQGNQQGHESIQGPAETTRRIIVANDTTATSNTEMDSAPAVASTMVVESSSSLSLASVTIRRRSLLRHSNSSLQQDSQPDDANEPKDASADESGQVQVPVSAAKEDRQGHPDLVRDEPALGNEQDDEGQDDETGGPPRSLMLWPAPRQLSRRQSHLLVQENQHQHIQDSSDLRSSFGRRSASSPGMMVLVPPSSVTSSLTRSSWNATHHSLPFPTHGPLTSQSSMGSASRMSPEVTLVRSSLELQAQSKLASAFTSINKLKFEKLGLVGRHAETQVLQNCLHRLVGRALVDPPHNTKESSSSSSSVASPNRSSLRSSTSSQGGMSVNVASVSSGFNPYPVLTSQRKEVVLIGGPSGTGKSSLTNTLKETVVHRMGGILVRGKYDIQLKEQPLSGIGLACNELCREILYFRQTPSLPTSSTQPSLTSGASGTRRWGKHKNPTASAAAAEAMVRSIRTELVSCLDKPLLDVLEHIIPLLHVVLANPSCSDQLTGTIMETTPPKSEGTKLPEKEPRSDGDSSSASKQGPSATPPANHGFREIKRLMSRHLFHKLPSTTTTMDSSDHPTQSQQQLHRQPNQSSPITETSTKVGRHRRTQLFTRSSSEWVQSSHQKSSQTPVQAQPDSVSRPARRNSQIITRSDSTPSSNQGSARRASLPVVPSAARMDRDRAEDDMGQRRRPSRTFVPAELSFRNDPKTKAASSKRAGRMSDTNDGLSPRRTTRRGQPRRSSIKQIVQQRVGNFQRHLRAAVDDSSSSWSYSHGSPLPTNTFPPKRLEIDASQLKQLVQYAVRTFLQIFAARLGPVVIVLDDLQWADQSSLDMIKAIAGDKTIPNLMLIGCFRSDEVDAIHPLTQTIQTLRIEAANVHSTPDEFSSSSNNSGTTGNTKEYNLTELSVGNLPLPAVTELIVELLSVSSEKAQGLANICYKRTLGNVFFIKEFLILLHEMNILEFNIGNFQWTWSEEKVEQETAATFNVVSMIKVKIDKYPDGMVLFLSVAACLGSTFDITTVELLWGHLGEKYEGTSESVEDLLEVALREMLVEGVGDSSYRFIHDKVQETAMLLMPDDEYRGFRSDVGRCLYENLPDEDLESMLFVVADLLNNGMYEGMEMAELNASAAEKARELSAFHSAVHYVEKGIMSLNRTDTWKEHPYLTLLLYSIGAEVEKCAGNNDKSDWYCNQVRKQDHISILGKMRVNNIVVERLYSDGKYDELWSICLDTLDQLGCSLPRMRKCQKLWASWSMQQTKRFYLPVAKDVQDMPIIQDVMKSEAIAFMIKAASFCLGSKNKALYILLCCKCVRWTKRYGLTTHTASSFASFANVLMHEYGDWRTAIKIAEISLGIENRLGSNYTKSSTLHKINTFVLGWVKPLRTCRANYLEAYRVGMLSGNIGAVGMAILFFLICEFFSGGNKLVGLEQDLRNYIPQLEKLQLHTYVLGLRLLWQKVLNLMGAPYNPQTTGLTGTAMHGIDIERHPFIFNTVGRHHICNLCAYFAEYEKGAEIALEMGDVFYKTWSGAAYYGFEPFSRALCLYVRAAETGQAKYRNAARKARSRIAQWVRSGALNLVHELFLLDAEEAALRRNDKQAKQAYKQAIAASVRGGFLQDAGLANERYATFLRSVHALSDASFFMNEAMKYYAEWGATRKVQVLYETHTDLLQDYGLPNTLQPPFTSNPS